MSSGFDGVLNQLEDGDDYRKKPPYGPPDQFPSLSPEEVERIQHERDHDKERDRSYEKTKVVEEPYPQDIDLPSSDELHDIYIYSIDGSNQRVGPPAFKAILARAAVVRFEYTRDRKKRYHNISTKECQGIFISEGGIFKDTVNLFGDSELSAENDDEKILGSVDNYDSENPFLLEANEETGNPENEALGWAVKFQQTLELSILERIEDKQGVTIRDGPLLSTSAYEKDTINAMRDNVMHWDNQVLVSVSKNVDHSTLLIEALKNNKSLRDAWFPDQNLSRDQLSRIGDDSSVLDKIIEPGQRTPFIQAVNRQRTSLVETESDLTPIACYYLTQNAPQEYVRLEIPRFMWADDNYDINEAIRLVTWQHELGSDIPLVQGWAHRASQLQDEKRMIEDQIRLQLAKRELEPLGDWENE